MRKACTALCQRGNSALEQYYLFTLKLDEVLSFVYLRTVQMFIAHMLSKEITTFTGQLLLLLVAALCKAQNIKLWDLHLPNTTLLVNKSDEVSKETFKTVYSPFLHPAGQTWRKAERDISAHAGTTPVGREVPSPHSLWARKWET